MGDVDGGLPQAKPGEGNWGRERGCEGGKNQGEHGADVPCNPPAKTQADDASEAGRPSDGPYGDDGEELAGSDDSPAPAQCNTDGCWRWRGCSAGRNRKRTGYRGAR